MRALSFAWRCLIRQPARSGLGILGIAAVGALLFDMLLLSRGLVVSFRELLGAFGFDVRVAASEALVGPKLARARAAAAAIAALPEVTDVLTLRFGEANADAPGRAPLEIALLGAAPSSRRPWSVLTGRDLGTGAGGGAPEALINQALAGELKLRPGSTLKLRGACASDQAALAALEFRVVGVASFSFETARRSTTAISLEDLLRVCGAGDPDHADLLLVASREGAGADAAASAIRRLRPDLHAFTNEQIVARFQRLEFSYFRQISAVLATLTLFFGFLLITVLLTVSVNQRLGEIAALRALGFSQRRVVADVLCQSALLVGGGGLLALPLGTALSAWLDRVLKAMPEIPERVHFFVFEPRALYLHLALLALTALLAALYPMLLVSRLEIAATLRNETVS